MRYIITTTGLMCGHCDASVESALLKVPGVTGADADHETQTVEVEAGEAIAEEALIAAVRAAGEKFDVAGIAAA